MGSYQVIPFGHQTAESRSGVVSLERVRNLYAEQAPPNAKTPVVLYPTPGLRSWATVGDGPCRGIERMGGDLYVVSGSNLYVIDSVGNADLLGSVVGTGSVQMTNNGTHVAIATSTKIYAANRSEILELPESGMNGATYQDGYGIFTQTGTQKWWLSNLDDMTDIDGLDFTTADALTGSLQGVVSDHREVWVFKDTSIEVYYNSGDSDFPFSRTQVIERGCHAPNSISKARNSVFWLGDDLTVYMAGGYNPQPISPPWIERLIKSANDPGSAVGWTYAQDGHTFYVLTFTDLTLGFDLTTQMWHDRKSSGMNRWRAVHHAEFFDKQIVGDVENGQLYELDLESYDDDGDIVMRQVTSPPVHANGNRVAAHELYADMEMGVGLTTGQGSDPQAMLEWSDDGGRTWSNEIWADIGKIGEGRRRARWNRLGQFRERTFRLSVSDPVKTVVLGAKARLEVLGR